MSIPHFDKLSLKRQTIFLNHPEQFTCQEKVDGSNLFIGRTDGKMWVSRKSAKDPIYLPDDWGNPFWVQNFKNAHAALLQLEDELVQFFGEEFQLESEILSSGYPNTIDYENSLDQIVIFKPEVDVMDLRTATTAFVPYTTNGLNLQTSSHLLGWKVCGLPSIPQSEWVDVVKECAKPDVDYSTYEMLIRELVRPRTSLFSDSMNSHVNIEGLVFRHNDGWMLKLVDRAWFTKLNTDNYRFRKLLFRSPGAKGTSIMDQFTRESEDDIQAAAVKALNRLGKLHDEYDNGEHLRADSIWVHRRNLEALYSVRHQMYEILNGR